MTDLATQNKSGRVKVAFGDVVKLVRERSNNPELDGFNRVVGLEHLDPGELKISRWADIADGTTFTNVFRSGQVLFGKRRAYQRKVALASFEGVCSGDIYVLESSSPFLMPELLPYICQSDAFFDHAVGTSAGSLSPRTNWTSLASFEFMLPPLQEQARIVTGLQSACNLTNKLSSAVKKNREARRAAQNSLLFEPVFRGTLEFCRLGDIAIINPTDPPLAEDAPFFPMEALTEWEREVGPSEKRGRRNGVRAKSLDVLMARITPCLENGKIAQVPIDVERCGGSTEFVVFRPRNGVPANFLYWLITSDRIRDIAISLMQGTTGRQRVSGDDLKRLRIAKFDETEMTKIGDQIDRIDEARVELQKRYENSQRFYRKLLNSQIGDL